VKTHKDDLKFLHPVQAIWDNGVQQKEKDFIKKRIKAWV